MDWASLLLASLISGATLGDPLIARLSQPDQIDALAAALAVAPEQVVHALDLRGAHLRDTADITLASETLALITPLADRLGLAATRASLEDESFRALDPATFSATAAAVGDAPAIDALIASTNALMRAAGIDATVTGRTKSLYSVHKKQLRKGVRADEVYDRVGLRVHVNSVADCYAALDVIHAAHMPIFGELDDYIATPKPSGYQSLHTAVMLAGLNQLAEVQVRTHEMHAASEHGDHAHWRYKLNA